MNTWPDRRAAGAVPSYSKIRSRANSAAPFAPLATDRSSLPLSSMRTQPPPRGTIAPILPRPAIMSPGRVDCAIDAKPHAASLSGDDLDRPRVWRGLAGRSGERAGRGHVDRGRSLGRRPEGTADGASLPARLGEDRQVLHPVDARLPAAIGE